MLRGRGVGQTSCTPGQTGYPPSSPWQNVGETSTGSRASATAAAPTAISQCAQGTAISASQENQQSAKLGAEISAGTNVAAAVSGPAAPFVMIAGDLAAFAVGTLHIGQGCGASCINATEVANYVECVMGATLNLYMNQPAPRYASAQAAALSVFNSAWNYLVQGCGAVSSAAGSPGQRCITERNRGGKYDDWHTYYDPIANDPCVIPDPSPINAVTGAATTAEDAVSSAVSAIAGIFSGITGGSSSLLVPALIVGAMILLGGSL